MTKNQILDTMLSCKYVLVRKNDTDLPFAVNTSILHIAVVEKDFTKSSCKHIQSITPCNFNEYISNKIPFITIYNS